MGIVFSSDGWQCAMVVCYNSSMMNGQPVRVRIAPSPTGDPHVGTAYIGLFDYVLARQTGGQFVLRIEDTDRGRFQESSARAVIDALGWLQLTPDEGPGLGGAVGPYVQSERIALYQQHAEALVNAGHAYYCFCSRERLTAMREAQEAEKQAIKYDRHCLSALSDEERAARVRAGDAHVIRMRMPESGVSRWHDLVREEVSFDNALLDDQVLLKADGYPTYHLANVVDDHLMSITTVIRAEEWISSTPKHLVLYQMFGWQAPEFAHLPLLRNADRSKISKRHSHTSLNWYREEGFLPQALLNFLALLGWSHPEEKEIFSLEEMIEKFSFARFNKTGPIFDMEKLRWMNGMYLREMPLETLYPLVEPYLIKAGLLPAEPDAATRAFAAACLQLEQEKARTLNEYPALLSFFFTGEFEYEAEALQKWLRPAPAHISPCYLRQIALIEATPEAELTSERYEAMTRAIAGEIGVGAGKVIHPTRVAMSGRTKGPSLFHMMELLGKDEVLARFRRALAMMNDEEAR